MIHVVTKGGKAKNPSKVRILRPGKKKIHVRDGSRLKIKAKQIGKGFRKHRAMSYESSDTKIAVVSRKGVIKGKTKGRVKIYVYAQNGIYKAITVTVQ